MNGNKTKSKVTDPLLAHHAENHEGMVAGASADGTGFPYVFSRHL